MKMRSLTVLGIATLGSITVGMQYSQAQGARGFYCDTSGGVPVTMYQNAQGGVEPWIRWTSNHFRGAGYDTATRCQEVSGRMETYRRNKQLKFITVGRMNGQNVVCTASQVNGRCEGLIFTLKPREDGVKTLHNLLAWRSGQAGVPSLSESGAVPYIDVSGRLGEDGGSAAPSAPSNVQPQPSQGGMREL